MYFKNPLLALALAVATVEATTTQGFNYGATKQDGSPRAQADFKSQFSAAKSLKGASDFNSARLYTMIQGGTTNTPTEAIQAAIDEETSLLLGLWASGGGMENEITALKSAIKQYGDKFAKLVVGISVGSEDLYRNSVTGARSPEAGPGVNPDILVQHIKDVRSAIEGTGLSEAAVGHVDTWDAWTNGTNSEVIDNCDWLGFDGYPYYQNSMDNGIDNAKSLFDESVDKTKGVAKNKPVWITETGWPVSGPQENKATASVENAKKFWDQVGCSLFGNTNTWWYILEDAGASPSFGLTKSLNSDPLFDLTCPSDSTSSSSVANPSSTGSVNPTRGESASASASGSSGGADASGSGSGSGSAASATPTASGFASQAASGSASGKASSTPMASASATGSSSSGSGSGSGSSSSGSSGSASSNGGASSSSASASASSSPAMNAADRPAGSIFGAVAAFLALAIAV